MNAVTPLLSIKNITSGYGEAMVVHDVSLAIEPGEIVALLGKNGMGKSTLLKTIMGYLPTQAGSIDFAGQAIAGLAPHRIAQKAIAYSPQEHAIFQDLTVRDNLLLGLKHKKDFAREIGRVEQIFPILGQRLHQRAGTLSGGEQKMLLIARALMAKPKLILIDEITEGLQPSVVQKLATALSDERAHSGVAMLLIEQHIQFALEVSDRWAILKLGEIDEEGSSQDANAEHDIAHHLSVS